MSTNHRESLARIRRFDQLVAFLRDDLDWPIGSGDFQEMTFDYTPEELGIDTKNAAKIQGIKRLRPLTPNQPWGIFFVKFEPKRLPVVALRSILARVVLKKRASANHAERPVWAMEDLLFISNYGEKDVRHISIAHFAVPEGKYKLPTLKVLGWDDRDTALHLDAVAKEMTEHLAWPDDQDDTDAWRQQWRSAFILGHREVITTSQQLAIHLAALARATRNRILSVLEIETENGHITRLMNAFQNALLQDLDRDGFADMVAQTIAYGLLSARIADPRKGTAEDLADHMRTNPLLRDLMATFLQIGGANQGTEIDFDELGVSEVVDLLDQANMEAVVRDFGDRNPQEDPVIHFYEHFLAEYDKKQKVSRGVFYTPRPVVSYIVRSVDKLLRIEFGLEDGLADTSTWIELAERCGGLTIPDGVSPDQAFVQILDPATGTGTFLVEVIDSIHKTLKKKWFEQGCDEKQVRDRWNDYVSKHLLARLHGYELLMAPYAIAHLKIGLKLYETGYRFGNDERACVYLTNALEPAQKQLSMTTIPALAEEAKAVDEAKRRKHFSVVIGNPPYSGHSANKGRWIASMIDDYKKGFPELRKPAQAKWLSDDYVKFIRFAQSLINRTGTGTLGFISNHSYLDNTTFRGMRKSLLQDFTDIHLLDLHGNSKKKECAPDGRKDENVFDIQQGVAIGLLVKGPIDNNSLAQVLHTDLWGKRDAGAKGGKYGWLASNDIITTASKSVEVSPRAPQHLFVPRDEVLIDEYEEAWPIPRIFSPSGYPAPGIITTHDQFAISWTRKEAASKVERLLATRSEEEARNIWRLCSQKQWRYDRAMHELCEESWRKQLKTILYRPFDFRVTVFNRNVAVHRRERVMRHMLAGKNLALHVCRQTVSPTWQHVLITDGLTDDCYVSNKTRERGYIFPLYVYPLDHAPAFITRRTPNLVQEYTKALSVILDFEFICEGAGDLETNFGPEDVIHYIYAVLHSPEYRRRYADFLKSDFPRIPLPRERVLFQNLVEEGRELLVLHMLESPKLDKPITTYIGHRYPEVDRVGWSDGTVWLDARKTYARKGYRATKPGTFGFSGVPVEVWDFHIGGYQVCHKWLKDRKGRTLSDEDITHYQKIIVVLDATIRIMAKIDEVIEVHGGWPDAFKMGSKADAALEMTMKEIPEWPPKVEPAPEDRYVTCVPLVPLKAAAGGFSDSQYIEDDAFEWVSVPSGLRLQKGMFVAQVVGKSMEPAIRDGAWCLFRAPVTGTRQSKIVLVQLRDAIDPETGQRYTVKRYRSEKRREGDSWRHEKITLMPLNPSFEPIVLASEDEDELKVVAELVEVLRAEG